MRERIAAGLILSAIGLAILETLMYPLLASSLYRWVTGGGWDGSSLILYTFCGVAPGCALYIVVAAASSFLARGHRPAVQLWVGAGVFGLEVLLFVGSIIWYANTTSPN